MTSSTIVAGSNTSASITLSSLAAFALSNNPPIHFLSAYTVFTARVLSIKPLEALAPRLIREVVKVAVTDRERTRAILWHPLPHPLS